MKKPKCKIESCDEPVHAKGYCRKHYARMWRQKGRKDSDTPHRGGKRRKKANSERRKALDYELKNAKQMYDSVVGVTTRIKWRKRIKWLETELKGLESGVEDNIN
ncbi:MAG: hypothetical protein U5N86_01185 [Planctomycetota bacterium]|nr:hypothetical protein [Planctomycetota bacterium]